MTVQATTQFPGFLQEVQVLVDEHRQLMDEPLILAIYYKPKREQQDIFLFEVIDNFGNRAIDADRELFEVTYNSSSGFPLEPGQRLHLVLTNPLEFEKAVAENWSLVAELKNSISSGNFQTIYSDPAHPNLRGLVNA